jgi:hypothetical protein
VIGEFTTSGILNCTFKKIASFGKHINRCAVCINTVNYMDFTVDRCIFSQCSGGMVGALLFGSYTFFVQITRTRFEDNFGNEPNNFASDIKSIIPFNSVTWNVSFTLSSCSTSQPRNRRMCYNYSCLRELLNDCTDYIVIN